jgi:7-cyano-7-deazaguanine synthase
VKGFFSMSELLKDCNVVMLYSGGADSRLMLELCLAAGKKPHCVLIDYGQKHIAELDYAKKQLEKVGISYQIVSINGLRFDSGLTGSKTEGRWENVHEMNVPARNTIMLGIAMGIAENSDITEVWYGPDYSDRVNLFPDCYQEYVVKMNEVAAISGVRPIQIVAPLLGMTKELIKAILKNTYGVDDADMHSGYDAPKEDCGCDSIDHRCECKSGDVVTERGMSY